MNTFSCSVPFTRTNTVSQKKKLLKVHILTAVLQDHDTVADSSQIKEWEVKQIFGCDLIKTRIRKKSKLIGSYCLKSLKQWKFTIPTFCYSLSCDTHHPWCHLSPYGVCYLPHIWKRISLTSSTTRIYYCHPHSAEKKPRFWGLKCLLSEKRESHSRNLFALSMKSMMVIIILLIIMLSYLHK